MAYPAASPSALPSPQAPPADPTASRSAATIKEVAARAGVSQMTVSRSVTQPDRVAADTLARVRAAMAELNYVPNMAAVSLRGSQSRLVTVLVPALTTHMFDRMLSALTEHLAQHGYQVVVGQTQYRPDRELDLVRAALARRSEGIVMTGAVQEGAARALLCAAGIPVIEAGDLVASPIDMAVGMSHEALGQAACRYLADRGHRRLAVFSGDDARGRRRMLAFEAEAARLGLPPVAVETVPAPTSHAAGRRLMASFAGAGTKLDAVYCGSDMMAAGVLTECRARRIEVPTALAVMGTGDTDFAEALSPQLTSVRVDGARIGEVAASMLLARFAGEAVASPVADVGFEIVARESA